MGNNLHFNHRRLRHGLLAGVAGMMTFATPALAQQSVETDSDSGVLAAPQASEIIVTGSRIVRRDFESPSPIVTVDDALLKQSSTAAIESSLNKLPQFAPTLDAPTDGGDIQPTSQSTPGAATVSLRGLGSNRTLVLIDGRRGTPSNASNVVDINSIPSAAVERVEIISGGASSTYGADAVAGVVNFIMKRDFEGLELDAQANVTQEGDGFEYQVSGIMGTDFDDGRGNISLSFATNERNASYRKDRDYWRDYWGDTSITGTGFFPYRPGINLGFGNPVDQNVIDGIFSDAPSQVPNQQLILYTNPDGTVFSGFDGPGVPGVYRNDIVDGFTYKVGDNGLLQTNFTDAMLVLPLERYNMYARGNYELNDWIGLFAQGIFSKVSTRTVQEPSPVTGGWTAFVDYDPANPQSDLPDEVVQILNARQNPNAPFQIFQMMPFNRSSETDVYTYNMTVGLEGSVPDSDWTWEVFGSQSESETTVIQRGFASLQRYRTLINAPNFGEGFEATGNQQFGGFGASTATCTSGLNPFSGDPISEDCLEAIRANVKTKSVMQQSIWEANIQGGLFDLPAGQVRTAFGASYRKTDYEFQNDTLTTQGQSFQEQVLGLYPSGNSQGEITIKELYGELLIPILSDTPGFQRLDLEIGGRMSDYSTTGTSYTYKALAEWQITDWFRLRGGYNRAERAPNTAELFLAPEQTFAVATGGDVCSRANSLPYSANPATNPDAAQVEALCRVLMERSGDVNADEQFYDNTVQPAGAEYVFPTLSGNPDLKPEKADTWTLGAVIDSPFMSPALTRLRLSIDYYNIKVKDAIGAQSVDIAQRQCFDPAFNPDYDPNSDFCSGIGRNTVGTLGNVVRTFLNNGRFQTSGIDINLNWAFDAGPGTISLNSVFNYQIELKSSELPNLALVDYTGTFGPPSQQNGLDGGAFEWKLFTTLGYSVGSANVALQWQHLPATDDVTAATDPNTSFRGAPAYDLFNLNGSYSVTDNATIRFGVDNLFNKEPPLAGVNTNPPPGNLAGGTYTPNTLAYYDLIGRRFYVGANFKF
ncbi:TonB-dependent receptor plug domain-containing protein [Altericroceibacterium endophyticum]|uniref:TonB-dependent receptor n=1 Tax=Altericroceibacterium endophyticum TaxID=1808508 RepID=A0A6I4T4A7_9SPHN|nr:TonB-dependent receptor [Altericroceibacterium endophyticum]MXO64405.1 TonB-dependent receptor [Altericroceibacterium endophyticum]